MTHDEFWQLIDKTRAESSDNPTKQAELLVKALTVMPVEDIIDYQKIMDNLQVRAYRTNLWDAGYIIGEGCGDDGFKDFRAWVIGQGLDVYKQSLKNPEILVDVVEIDTRYDTDAEDLLYVALKAYNNKTHTTEGIPSEKFGNRKPSKLHRNSPCFSITEEDVRDKCLKKYYPKLWAKFGW